MVTLDIDWTNSRDEISLKSSKGPRDKGYQGLSYDCLVDKQLDKDKD